MCGLEGDGRDSRDGEGRAIDGSRETSDGGASRKICRPVKKGAIAAEIAPRSDGPNQGARKFCPVHPGSAQDASETSERPQARRRRIPQALSVIGCRFDVRDMKMESNYGRVNRS